MTSEDRALLARHVTSIDGNVYCLTNLPEEVIAVIFAYVSRSEHSFKENLLQLLKQGDLSEQITQTGYHEYTAAVEKAKEFHERWVVGYGHSSVAEHAVAHVGVEAISRLASAELELANPFLSFTEYSQRYQKPRRGGFFLPPQLSPSLASHYLEAMDSLYDIYEELYAGLVTHLQQTLPSQDGETQAARHSRVAKLAFEDARYALPLSTLTSLGMTGNGRALRDCIALLGASELPEVRELAQKLRTEISKVLPTLLRHATPSEYQLNWRHALPKTPTSDHVLQTRSAGAETLLIGFTGRGAEDAEEEAMQVMASAMAAQADPVNDASAFLQAAVTGLGPHDVPSVAFRWVRYDCLFVLSEAAWHQLLRHCRGMHFQWGPPEITNGYTVPPTVAAAGLEGLLLRAVRTSERLYEALWQEAPETAGYAVTNAHRRRVRSECDLRQLYHLVNLRTTPQAQWDIRDAITQLWDQVRSVHPRLAARAKRATMS